jgi:hypothetical protein
MHTYLGVVYKILKEAADVQDAAKFEKQTHLCSTLAAIDKTRRETEVAKAAAATAAAAIEAARPKRVYCHVVTCIGLTYSWQNLRAFSTSFIGIIYTSCTCIHLMYI